MDALQNRIDEIFQVIKQEKDKEAEKYRDAIDFIVEKSMNYIDRVLKEMRNPEFVNKNYLSKLHNPSEDKIRINVSRSTYPKHSTVESDNIDKPAKCAIVFIVCITGDNDQEKEILEAWKNLPESMILYNKIASALHKEAKNYGLDRAIIRQTNSRKLELQLNFEILTDYSYYKEYATIIHRK